MNSRNISKLRFIFFCLIFSTVFFSVFVIRAERPPFKVFTTEDGLAHDSINKIVRDSRGFLWFCTAEGLSRFDGTRFTNFTQDQGLPHRNITDFLETRDGTYLVGTSVGLVVFNPKGKAYRWNVLESRLEQTSDELPMFQTFAPETDNRQKKLFISLAEDADGTIWAGTGFGLYRVKRVGEKYRFEEVSVDKNYEISFNALFNDSKGGLIMVASYGLYRFYKDKIEHFAVIGGNAGMQTRDGKIWIGAGGESIGLRVFEFDSNDQLQLVQTYKKEDGLNSNSFQNCLIQLSDGKIYIGGQTNGLLEFLPNATPNEPKFHFLNGDITNALGEDSAGNLWLGTELKGAWKLVRSGFVSFGEKEGIAENADIRSIFANRNGEIFLTVQPNKLLYLTAEGKFENIAPSGVKFRSWGWNFLDFEAHDGEWWIASVGGLYRFPKLKKSADLNAAQPKHIYTKEVDGLWSNEIFNLFEDSRGDVWITIIGAGENTLQRWERKTDKIYKYSNADGIPKGSGGISFAEDRQGDVFIGHYFGGLVRYRNGNFRFFGAKDGLPESQIDDLLIDSDGRLWIATTGRGVFRIDDTSAETPVFTNLSTQNGLSSNQIICFTEDKFQQVYIGTGRGINRIDRNGNIRIFTQADGLPSNYTTRCEADSNGFLWFVSRSTLVRFAPEIERSNHAPPVYIDKISVNGVAQKISALGETEIDLPDFSSDQRQFQIEFFALTNGAGENVRYRYRLDEQDWSNPTEQQTLNLDLAAGKHFLEVRALRTGGIESEKSAIVSFRILPPIWARWWFILISALFVSAIILSLYYYRTANLREINAALTEANRAEENLRKVREERLAELEKVRSRIATDLHDDIGASLTQIAILSEVARAQSNGESSANAPLSKISDVSNELVGTMSDIVWSINPVKDHLSDLTQRMRRFAADIFSAKGIGFQFVLPPESDKIVVNSNVRREVYLIFKESVNNIIKHSEALQVKIKLDVSGKNLLLEISDNGKGFNINTNNLSQVSTDKFDEYGGNGVFSMQRRAEEMNGKLQIESRMGKGTTVKLNLPLEQNVKI